MSASPDARRMAHWRIERAQPVHARPAQDPADRGATESERLGDAPAVVSQLPKSQNLFYEREEVVRGHRRGREDRSPRPARPNSRYRPTHLAAVFALTLKLAAACFNVRSERRSSHPSTLSG